MLSENQRYSNLNLKSTRMHNFCCSGHYKFQFTLPCIGGGTVYGDATWGGRCLAYGLLKDIIVRLLEHVRELDTEIDGRLREFTLTTTHVLMMSSHYRQRGRSPPRSNSSRYSRNRSRSPKRDSYNDRYSRDSYGGGGGSYGGYTSKKYVLSDILLYVP